MEFMENNENQRQKAAASRFSIVQGVSQRLLWTPLPTRPIPAFWAEAEWTAPSTGRQVRSFWQNADPGRLCHRPGKAHWRLPASSRFVLHTPGPVWNGGGEGEEALLKSCYESCLKLAAENGCKTVAFPSISTGIYGFPLEKAAPIAVGTILRFLEDHQDMEVQMVCFDGRTRNAYEEAFKDWG